MLEIKMFFSAVPHSLSTPGTAAKILSKWNKRAAKVLTFAIVFNSHRLLCAESWQELAELMQWAEIILARLEENLQK